jgi:HAD superfamily hydrolase (TIGR01509 family)
MASGSSVTIVFWDLGGVILRGESGASPRLGSARLAEVTWPDRLQRPGLGRGDAGPRLRRRRLGSVGSLGLTVDERDILRADFFATDRIDEELVRFIRRIRPRARVCLISNAWPEIRGLLETQWGLADAFEPLVLSAEVGLAKPDPRIFRLALERAQVEPSQAAFVDDFPENVEAAAALGMRPVLFRTPKQAQDDVVRWIGGL